MFNPLIIAICISFFFEIYLYKSYFIILFRKIINDSNTRSCSFSFERFTSKFFNFNRTKSVIMDSLSCNWEKSSIVYSINMICRQGKLLKYGKIFI